MNKNNIKLVNIENIKDIIFNLSNTDTIKIPYQCFNEFDCGIDEIVSKEYDDIICSHLLCDIEDNGLIEFLGTFPGNVKSPIQVIDENTISSIIIVHNDNTEQYICTSTYYDEYDECYTVNQRTKMLTYKNIQISITPYIRSYCISNLFTLPINTKLKDDSNNTYIILSDENENKYLVNHENDKSVIFNEINVQAKYYLT